MAVTETVKIVFEVDDKPIASTVQQLQALGKISQEDAAKMNELSNASKNVSTSLGDAAAGAQQFATAGKDISNSSKDIANSAKGIGSAGKSIKDAGNDASSAANKFVPLRTRLKEAKEEVQRLVDAGFKPFSKEVLTAQARAGQLADEVGDLNRQVGLLNPESKIQAFTNFGQGIVGAFQVATGALQAFGVENEQVQQIAQRLQGALNLAQGIQSIIQLRESFSDLSVVISSTASASETIASGAKGFELIGEAAGAAVESSDELTESIEAGIGAAGNGATLFSTYKKSQDAVTTSTKGATVAQSALNRTMLANPIFLLATALGVLVGAMIAYKNSTDNAVVSEEIFQRIKKDSQEASDNLKDAENQLAIARDANAKFDIDRAKNKKALEEDLIRLFDNQRIAQEEVNKAQEEFNKLGQGAGLSLVKEREERLRLAKERKKETDQAIEDRKGEFNAVSELILLKEIEATVEKDKSEKAKKSTEALRQAAEARQQSLKTIDAEIALLQEAQRGALIGVEDEIERIAIVNSFRQQISEKQIKRAEITGESIKLIQERFKNDELQSFEDLFKAVEAQRDKDVADAEKAAADKLAAERRLLDEKKAILREEESIALIRNEASAIDESDLAEKNFNTQKEFLTKRIELEKAGSLEQQKLLAELDLLYKEYEKNKTKTAEEEGEARREIAEEIALESFDFIIGLNQEKIDREFEDLEYLKENELITEEQYQEKLKALKIKQARADKDAAIFNATIQFSQALINALTTTPATAAPAALAFAAAIAGANLAKVIATPLPKFKHGTLAVPGYDTGDDSVMAMLRPGEAVIPTEINREYANAIKAIYTRKVSAKDFNDFVAGRMSVVRDEPIFNFNPVTMDALFKRDLRVSQVNSALQRSTGGNMPTINVKADVDAYALGKVISRNKTMEVTNVESIGEAVAEALSKRTNRRQQI